MFLLSGAYQEGEESENPNIQKQNDVSVHRGWRKWNGCQAEIGQIPWEWRPTCGFQLREDHCPHRQRTGAGIQGWNLKRSTRQEGRSTPGLFSLIQFPADEIGTVWTDTVPCFDPQTTCGHSLRSTFWNSGVRKGRQRNLEPPQATPIIRQRSREKRKRHDGFPKERKH